MNALLNWFSELSPRERRLLSVLGSVFIIMVFFFVPFGVDVVLRSRRASNAELRDAVARVQAGRAAARTRQERKEAIAAKYARKAPKLGGFLEQLAKDQSVEIPEAQDKPEVPIGKRYVERATLVRLHKVQGLSLLRFLEKTEQSGYPIAITRLNIRKRGGEHDLYDVELGVSAYDRNDTVASTAPNGSAVAPTPVER